MRQRLALQGRQPEFAPQPDYMGRRQSSGMLRRYLFNAEAGQLVTSLGGLGSTEIIKPVGATIAAGKFGKCLKSDGSSNFMTLGTTFAPVAMSFVTWINFTSLANGYNTVYSRFVGAVDYFQFHVKSSGLLAPYVSGGVDISYDGTGTYTLSTGTWYHLVLSFDSASGLNGYVNGKLDKNVSSLGTSLLTTGTGTIALGYDSNTAGRTVGALWADSRVYSRALTQAEVLTLYQTPFEDVAPITTRIAIPTAAAAAATAFNIYPSGLSSMGGSGAGSKANLPSGLGSMG